ncbi:MAG TPA: cobalamin biosynthesis protein [Methyloprofundus sp.]|nr:cobalamin biosynthesis protein [Methyloprofundus sp.]HIL77411.1 cobalamin biosynthesis protein [Methylococcales bacterium]
MTIALALLIALILDAFLGEPKKGHPLVIFGAWASAIEKWLILPSQQPKIYQKIAGLCALLVMVLPITAVVFSITRLPFVNELLSPVLLYLCIAPKSLWQHTQAIYQPLQTGNLSQARHAIAMIVSRQTQQMDTQSIRKASIESTLENGADAIFAPIFWFVVAGPTGAVFYRLSNTLDAMWGYKNQRYYYFGFAAARLDDLLNWIPARLTALSYMLLGDTRNAWACYRQQSPHCESPNAGVVMSAGAGALNVNLGGPAIYHGQLKNKPILGTERIATNQDIKRANLLILLSTLLWLAVISAGEALA